MTNRERVGKALDELKEGLAPFLLREMENRFQQAADAEARRALDRYPHLPSTHFGDWDVAPQLSLIISSWGDVFHEVLGAAERSYCYALRDARRKWAHQENFTSDDVYRVFDDAERLLTAVGAAVQSGKVGTMKDKLLRKRFEESRRSTERRRTRAAVQSGVTTSLKPWRELITPHQDVMRGDFQQAEFAADLWQVHIGQGTAEYADPAEFFRRTFLTSSLKQLLELGMKRLTEGSGDPVIQLQTNFGGGKTHSMLALYHLFGGADPGDLIGVEDLMTKADITTLAQAKRVVLVGNKISPGNPIIKEDGTEVRTLWGEMAWQLGGKEAFDRVAEDDKNSTSPGDVLRELFNDYGPCLILIDEWVAYARQLHDTNSLPGGNFETHFSFAQALAESAKLADNCLLVVSLPASDTGSSGGVDDIEVGGQRGRDALDRLRNVMGRMDTVWRPATSEEGFEIVRRRLFQPMTDSEGFKQRDVIARAFVEMYSGNPTEFPSGAGERDYEERIQRAFPIHPEVFDRLYGDWSSLVKFQRTRGVLRLMATVIHDLWREGDNHPLILPAHIPVDGERVNFELTRYLSDPWRPIIDKDVDGMQSMPSQIDEENPNLGRYSAARKVARTIFMGTAPMQSSANRGVDMQRINIGSVLPGESTNIFGDALRRMVGRATYLYHDNGRYWYDTQPTIARTARERAEQLSGDPDRIHAELLIRIKALFHDRGGFARIHLFPGDSSDIQDDQDLRLVVLDPEHAHSRNSTSSAGLTRCTELLENRGNAPRVFRNTLVFLCADTARKEELEESIRTYLAWKSIEADTNRLNLTPNQVDQVKAQIREAESNMKARVPECFQRLLIPTMSDPKSREIEWSDTQLTLGVAPASEILRKLERDEVVVPRMGGNILRMKLDGVPLWRGDFVAIKQLAEDFATYLYLPKLKSDDVLLTAVADGVGSISWASDGFAYAERHDDAGNRFVNLKAGEAVGLAGGGTSVGLVIKPDVAANQLAAERGTQEGNQQGGAESGTPDRGGESAGPGSAEGTAAPTAGSGGGTTVAPTAPVPKRYFASVELNSLRVGRQGADIASEVLSHLGSLPGANITVTLEIQADLPEGIPTTTERIVTENGNTLGFRTHGFETDTTE